MGPLQPQERFGDLERARSIWFADGGIDVGGTSPGDGWWINEDGIWFPADSPPDLSRLPPPPLPPGPSVHGTAGESAEAVARNWAKGAEGERLTSEMLNSLPAGWHVFHDLKIPNSQANIDHLVIGPTGVRVIDTKAHDATFTYSKGMLWNGRYSLRQKIETVEWMTGIVSYTVGYPADPVLCFVYADLPRPAQMIGRARVVTLEALKDLLTSGPHIYTADQVETMAERALHLRVPPRPKPRPPTTRRLPPPPAQGTPVRPNRSPSTVPPGAGSRRPLLLLAAAIGLLILITSGVLATGAAFVAKTATGALTPTTTAVVVGQPGPTTEPAAAPAIESPRMPVTVTCPIKRGTGYTASFTWPGFTFPTPRPVGYLVSVQVNELEAKLYRWDDHGDTGPPRLERVAPDTTIRTTSIALMQDGTTGAPAVRVAHTPTDPC